MLVPKEMIDGLNEMISYEMTAVKQYLVIGARLLEMGYPNFARKYLGEVASEQAHAMKEIDYITKVGGKVVILPERPIKTEFNSVEEVVKTALEMETNFFHFQDSLIKKAKDLKDTLTEKFLGWFLENQVIEINENSDLLLKVQKLGEDRLFLLENSMQGPQA